MNLQNLQKLISRPMEIKIIGKTTEIKGVIYHVMGIVRYDSRIRLLALQYDEDFVRRVEEAEIAELDGLRGRVQTNRESLTGNRKIGTVNIFQAVSKVEIDDIQFNVEGIQNTRCNLQNWEIMATFAEFLRLGWDPTGIDYQNIDNLFFTRVEFAGEFDSIPNLGENPMMKFITRPEHTSYLVEQPVTLLVGAQYQDKLWFRDLQSGEKHWVQINRVYLCDLWADMLKNFDDPRLKEQFTPEELNERKADFESRFSEICPRGMRFPVIEYECEEGLTLQFYSKAWLDAEPEFKSSSMGFIIRPDEKSGILGFPLKAALIQEPMPENTDSIESELFWYNKCKKSDDVII